jgi:hypothetical protein
LKKRQYILLVFGLITIVSCKSFKNPYFEKGYFAEYQGGRFGYDYLTLKIYTDSTYYFDRWTHNQVSVKDYGNWNKSNDTIYFNSKRTLTESRFPKNKSNKKHFSNIGFIIKNDTLQRISKVKNKAEYNKVIFTLIKVR